MVRYYHFEKNLGFLTLATYFKFMGDLALQISGIVFMPLGWFGIWEGLSKLIDTSPVVIRDSKLFEKLQKATYHFKYIDSGTDESAKN